MFLILACLFLARRYGTSAAPVAPSLAESLTYDAPIFTRDECSNDCSCPGRTIWDIVWSCLATTFAVTWVSVHPNVPFLEESNWTLLKRRIFLMCLALLAPEVMIMWAFKQWRGAVEIRERINKARPKSSVQWTMTHAHFLQMGGFKVNHVECYETDVYHFYRYKTKKEGITVQENVLLFYELRQLLEKQLIDFPDTTVKEIEDRSKGDALSKGVALLQIGWFIIQLIARAHQHLTITEIELTTAALAGLNSIMYLFWWSKPLDVRCPIIIKTKKLEGLFAERALRASKEETEEGGEDAGHDCSRSAARWTFSKDAFQLRDYLRESPAWVALDLAVKTLCPVWICTVCSRIAKCTQTITSASATHLRSFAKWPLKAIGVLLRLLPHRTKKDPEFELQNSSNGSEDSSETGSDLNLRSSDDGPQDFVHDSEVEAQMSTECSQLTTHLCQVVGWIWWTCTVVITKLFYLPHLLMFVPIGSILDSPIRGFMDGDRDAKVKLHSKSALELLFDKNDMQWMMMMIFCSQKAETRPLLIFSGLAGAAFGSIHCAAWHFTFPSLVEWIIWQTASLSIVGVCLCIVGGIPVYAFVERKYWRTPPSKQLWKIIKDSLETIPAIVYPLSRLSLLILALISLRDLPGSAFEAVTWTKFIPHI